jgi:cell division transport system ATP-binding protein
VIRFTDVSKEYSRGGPALTNVSFHIDKGAFAFLTGPSGSGKSTLLKLAYLDEWPTTGVVEISGVSSASARRADVPFLRRRIGVVFQDFRLIDHLSTLDNVALPLRIAGVREAEVKKHVTELLAWVGLADHLRALPATLSGGQQQRVAIARAVIGRPSLLLADEPTGNVDDVIGLRLMYLFEELNRLGTTVVIATHNDTLVSRFNHRQLRIESNSIRVFDPRPMTGYTPPAVSAAGTAAAQQASQFRRPGTERGSA